MGREPNLLWFGGKDLSLQKEAISHSLLRFKGFWKRSLPVQGEGFFL